MIKKSKAPDQSIIDRHGFRLNVGIVLTNSKGQVFWGRRYWGSGWQFPQGGLMPYETLEEAMFRELFEETGLKKQQVKILARTPAWYFYRLPLGQHQRSSRHHCIGQRQKWFLLRLSSEVTEINVLGVEHPEFKEWRWIDY